MQKSWTPEEDERLCAMRRKGMAFSAIARELHRTGPACNDRYLRLIRGEIVPGMGRGAQPWTPEEDAMLVEAYRSHAPLWQLSSRIGRTEHACKNRARILGVAETRLPPQTPPDCLSLRRCHDCGKPTVDYRCSSCRAKFRRRHGVSEFCNDEEGLP